jgi:KEOPS complex subunit Cgi121
MKIKAYRCDSPVEKDIIEKYPGIQVVDSTLLFGLDHIKLALEKAEDAFRTGSNTSDNTFVEVLLWASAQRQIKRALAMYGLNGSQEVVVFGAEIPTGFSNAPGVCEVEIMLDKSRLDALKRAFSITDTEMGVVPVSAEKAVKELICERISLGAIQ